MDNRKSEAHTEIFPVIKWDKNLMSFAFFMNLLSAEAYDM